VALGSVILGSAILGSAILGSLVLGHPPGPGPLTRLAPALPQPPQEPWSRQVEIERCVGRGLAWLAATQEPGGGWTADAGHKQRDDYRVFRSAESQRRAGSAHLGVSSLAGLAFLAAGHVPGRGPHSPTVQRVIDYVTDHSLENGYLTDGGSRMYSHAFATLFLSQVHGMLRAPAVEPSLRAAVQLIVDAQTRFGAWRYTPYTTEGDLSVTVCQLQALRAAREVGIAVPWTSIERAIEYVKESRITDGRYRGTFYYKITGRGAFTRTTFAINAAAVTSLHSAGVYDESEYGPALAFIEESYAEISDYYPDHYYFWYGNYYAAQALHLVGGARWTRYWTRLRDDLIRRQRADGSWRNDVGPGDAFATAVACLLLQIPNGYLPIFQK
jgi:hypothetical protein